MENSKTVQLALGLLCKVTKLALNFHFLLIQELCDLAIDLKNDERRRFSLEFSVGKETKALQLNFSSYSTTPTTGAQNQV